MEDYGAGIVTVHHFGEVDVHGAPQRCSQLRKTAVLNKWMMLDKTDSDVLLFQCLDKLISLLSRNLKSGVYSVPIYFTCQLRQTGSLLLFLMRLWSVGLVFLFVQTFFTAIFFIWTSFIIVILIALLAIWVCLHLSVFFSFSSYVGMVVFIFICCLLINWHKCSLHLF